MPSDSVASVDTPHAGAEDGLRSEDTLISSENSENGLLAELADAVDSKSTARKPETSESLTKTYKCIECEPRFACALQIAATDTRFAALLERWQMLPEYIRAAILVLSETGQK